MFAFLSVKPKFIYFVYLIIVTFLVRSALFYFYVQHEERYCQPDSPDYYISALCLKYGYGMYRPDIQRPIFWRTPGYPWYLSFFYKKWGAPTTDFAQNAPAHKKALWVQIFLCSLLPLLAFWLALVLTASYPVAWLTALISVVHPGFILASAYLLTDGLAMLFFVLFLIFYYRSFVLWLESSRPPYNILINIAIAAVVLALYTWMRPMGQFIAIIAALLLLFSKNAWHKKITQSLFFLIIFFALLAPWFVRNYRLTGHYFFCPLFGLYFNVFNAPKILSRVDNIPLLEAHTKLTQAANYETFKETQRYQQAHSPYVVCGEMVCLKTALPLIKDHPWYFMYDWCVEVIKTTFDLYASQLVALANNCFKWDPLVEYLPEKIVGCLYAQPLSVFFRLIAWLELLFMMWLWFCIGAGIWCFLIVPCINSRQRVSGNFKYSALWLKTGIIIGAVVMQTGGFGYARLRLPIELLLIILALSFWFWFKKSYK